VRYSIFRIGQPAMSAGVILGAAALASLGIFAPSPGG
jgi:hypothetical protein